MIQAHRVMAHRRVVRNGTKDSVTPFGLTFDDVRAAEALALLEGLERLFGLGYCDPKLSGDGAAPRPDQSCRQRREAR